MKETNSQRRRRNFEAGLDPLITEDKRETNMSKELKEGQRLSEEEVMARIREAVEDICEDLDDMADLHNKVARGMISYSLEQGDYVVMRAFQQGLDADTIGTESENDPTFD